MPPTTEETGKTLGQLAKEIVTAEPTPEIPPNGQLLEDNNLKVMHFRPNRYHRGMTIAFRAKNRNTIEIATAITHTVDTFAKKVGTRTAVEHFTAGNTTLLPIPTHLRKSDLTHTLRFFFG